MKAFSSTISSDISYQSQRIRVVAAEIEKDGVPTDDRVAEIFEAIIPLFPTPQIITFDLHFSKAFTLLLNDSLFEYLSFSKALICNSITFLPIFFISFFIFNETKYHP